MNAFAFLPLTAFLANVLLGTLILYRNHRSRLNILYTLFAFALAIWALGTYLSFTSLTSEAALYWNRLTVLGSLLVPIFLLHFFLVFTQREFISRKISCLALYAPALLFIPINLATNLITENATPSYWGYSFANGVLYLPVALYIVGYFVAGIVFCYTFYSKTRSTKEKIQSKFLMIAVAFPLVGGILTEAVPSIVRIEILPLSTTYVTISAIIIATAIIKYRLMTAVSLSIQKKLTATFLAFVLVFGTVISFTANAIAKEAIEDDIKHLVESVAQSRAAHVEAYLGELEDHIGLLSSTESFIQLLTLNRTNQTEYSQKVVDVNEELNRTKDVYDRFLKISIIDGNGSIVASTGPSPLDIQTEEVMDILESQGRYIADIHPSVGFGEPCMDFAFPIFGDDGGVLGGIIADIGLTELYDILTDTTGLGETGEVYLVNRSGFMISPSRFYNDSYNEEHVIFQQKVDTENVRNCFENEAKGIEHDWHDKVNVYPGYRNVRVLGTHVYIPEMQWALLAEKDESEAFQPLYSLQTTMLLVLGFVAIVGIILSISISRSISRPIVQLKRATQRIGKGELNTRIDVKSTDEVEGLASAFSQMTEDLKVSRQEIENYSLTLEKQVAERTRELEARRKELRGKVERLKRSEAASLNIMEDLNEALTERRQAEEAVRESEKRYRILAENVIDVIWATDLIGRFTYISPSVENMLGYTADELNNMQWKDYMTPDSTELALTKLEEELTTGNMGEDPSKSVNMELELVRKDGSTVWTETETTFLRDKDGQFTGFLGVARDVTVRRKIIEDLERSNEELRNAQSQLIHSEKLASIGTLASGIAHEVNNPLAAITGYGEAILDEDDPEKMRSYAKKIVSAVDRASDVVRWLSKHSRQTKDANIVDVNLNEVLADSLEAMKLTRSSANVEVVTNCEDIPTIRGNRNELLQIFINMLNNSGDAMPEGGRITISTREKGNLVEVDISDTGVGIPKEHIAQVFDPFFTTKEVGEGTGLGLYVASMIVRRHQGTIEVHSNLGKGTTFTLRFPTKEYISELRESVGFEKGEASEDGPSEGIQLGQT